jgi:hypothetical protein
MFFMVISSRPRLCAFWIAGHAHRNVAAGEIVLTLGDQHFASYDELLLDGGMGFFLHRPALHFRVIDPYAPHYLG